MSLHFETSVYSFRDYVSFLNGIYNDIKEREFIYTQKDFGRELGLSEPRISSLLKGKEGISQKRAQQIARSLELSDKESEYFFNLVLSTSSKSKVMKSKALEYINLNFNRKNHYQPMESWKILEMQGHDIIWSLITIASDFSDLSKIAKIADISIAEVKDILVAFQDHGLIEMSFGKIKALKEHIAFGNSIPSQAIRSFHKDKLNKALESVDTQSTDKRVNESLTFTLNPKDLPLFRQKIEKFIDDFLIDASLEDHTSVAGMSVCFYQIHDKTENSKTKTIH